MFKAGWKDIFRMNQNELESEIHKVSRDSTLDPRRKAYLIQNLMTRFVLYNRYHDIVQSLLFSCIHYVFLSIFIHFIMQSLDRFSAEFTSGKRR